MAPISRTPSSSNCDTRKLCGPAKAKSIFFAIPNSNSVSCSGRLMLEMIKCRSCNFFGSTLTKERDRKSACFWLSPSSTIRSPGAISTSRDSTNFSFGSSRPLIQDEISCKRLLFSSRRVVQQRGDLCCVSLFIRLFLLHSQQPFDLARLVSRGFTVRASPRLRLDLQPLLVWRRIRNDRLPRFPPCGYSHASRTTVRDRD